MMCGACFREVPSLWEVPICGCKVCRVCVNGVLNSCPVCETTMPGPLSAEAPERREGDVSGWGLVGAVLGGAVFVLWFFA